MIHAVTAVLISPIIYSDKCSELYTEVIIMITVILPPQTIPTEEL